MLERALVQTNNSEALPPSYDVNFDRQHLNEPLIRKNLETDLGERFNVEISQVQYTFENQLLKAQNDSEPFIESIKRGIQNRRKYVGDHDRRRELAEFENFNKIQTLLLGNDLVVSVSARGPQDSCYQRNYFDFYEKTSGGDILMTRFSSQMTNRQFAEAIKQIDPDFETGEEADDIDLLLNPVATKLNKDQILEIFHPDQKALKEQELEKLLLACQPLIGAYLRSLMENPIDAKKYRRALLNFADDFIFKPKARELLQFQLRDEEFIPVFASQLAQRPVRFTVTGCGAQGDPMSNVSGQLSIINLPYSVVDLASSKKTSSEKTLECRCPFCNRQVEASISFGRITCPECGNSAAYQC